MEVKYYQRINRFGRLADYAEFDGIEFCRNGDYFVNNKYGKLHRYIYEYYNGKIPKRYVIHHKDHNPLNNDINNLVLLTNSEHIKLHNTGQQFSKEHKQKISKTNTGKTHSEESKIKQSEAHKGKHHSRETKQKISRNQPNFVPITNEMISDYKNGIKRKDFCSKYNVSQTVWDKIRKILK